MSRPPAPVDRLAIQFGTLFGLAMILVGVIVFGIAEHRLDRRVDEALAYHSDKFVNASANAGQGGSAGVAARIQDWQRRKIMSERTYILFDPKGKRIAGRLALPPLPEGYTNVLFRGGGTGWQTGRALSRRLADGGLFVVVQESAAAESLRAMLLPLLGAVLASALLAGLAATLLFAHLTAKRLVATQATAAAIAEGDLTRRIDVSRLDGMFAVQAHSLNAMLDRMELMVNTQRHFASALAHDLRTPLTRLKAILARARARTAGAGAEVQQAERECSSIIALFESLLRLSEIETGRHANAMRVHDLGELVRDGVETMEPVLADAGSMLIADRIAPGLEVMCDEALITQLLINLLDNVVSHTPAGTRATVSLEEHAGRVVLTMTDDGPGLSRGDRERVLRPFERGNQAKAGGSGLGLAIARAIVNFHHGELQLGENRPGLAVRIELPLVDRGHLRAA